MQKLSRTFRYKNSGFEIPSVELEPSFPWYLQRHLVTQETVMTHHILLMYWFDVWC